MSSLPRLLAAPLAVLLVLALDAVLDPAFGEPAALRWCRKAGEHPVRMFISAALVSHALRPRSGARPSAAAGSPAHARGDAAGDSESDPRFPPSPV